MTLNRVISRGRIGEGGAAGSAALYIPRSRWLASSLVKAFAQARDLAFSGLDETAALPYVLPWVYQEIGRVRALMGDDYWSYGLTPANLTVLSTFLRYAREQGLADDGIEPEDLFAPETRDELAI